MVYAWKFEWCKQGSEWSKQANSWLMNNYWLIYDENNWFYKRIIKIEKKKEKETYLKCNITFSENELEIIWIL